MSTPFGYASQTSKAKAQKHSLYSREFFYAGAFAIGVQTCMLLLVLIGNMVTNTTAPSHQIATLDQYDSPVHSQPHTTK